MFPEFSKRKTATSVCLLQTEMETENFSLFAANGNGSLFFLVGKQQIVIEAAHLWW
jgi:hypothetical protein